MKKILMVILASLLLCTSGALALDDACQTIPVHFVKRYPGLLEISMTAEAYPQDPTRVTLKWKFKLETDQNVGFHFHKTADLSYGSMSDYLINPNPAPNLTNILGSFGFYPSDSCATNGSMWCWNLTALADECKEVKIKMTGLWLTNVGIFRSSAYVISEHVIGIMPGFNDYWAMVEQVIGRVGYFCY